MFEYAALVDAPVQRFTGIVTGADPDNDLVTVSVVTPSAHGAVAVMEAPALLVAVVTEPVERPVAPPAPPAPPTLPVVRAPASVARPRPGPAPAPVPAPGRGRAVTPAPSPSFVPALVGAAIAGLTAMWWLRRESHDRRR